jgi:NAD(P)H dehydrogenase (quinone)
LAGDEAYTLDQLAQEISKQTGKDIPYQNLAEREYSSILKGVGLPEGLAEGLASWDVSASNGDLFDNSKTLSQLIGHPTTDISEAVNAALN